MKAEAVYTSTSSGAWAHLRGVGGRRGDGRTLVYMRQSGLCARAMTSSSLMVALSAVYPLSRSAEIATCFASSRASASEPASTRRVSAK